MTIDNNKKQSIIFDGGYKDFNIKPHLPGDKVNSELLNKEQKIKMFWIEAFNSWKQQQIG